MKSMKKLASLLLALAMIFALATTAFAGTITVSGEEGETYTAYKIFDVTYAETDGTHDGPDSYSYTINFDSEWYSVVNAYNPTDNKGFTLEASSTANVYNVIPGDGFSEADAAAFAKYLNDNKPGDAVGVSGTITTDTDVDTTGTVSIIVNDPGYYFVTTTLGSLCILNTADADVSVNEKNEVPTQNKEVEEEANSGNWGDTSDGEIGETVNYKVTIQAKKGTTNYVLHDKMTDGLTFNPSSVVVTKGDQTVDAANNWELVNTGLTDGCTFEIKLNFLNGAAADSEVVVSYSATINDNAVIAGAGNQNESFLKYGNAGETTHEKVTTYVWEFNVLKYTGNDTPLANAKFSLYTDSACTNAIKLSDKGNNVYAFNSNGNVTEITTDTTGKFTIQGLDSGTYYLKETDAPDGYNILKEAVTVIIDKDGNVKETADGAALDEKTVKVENKTGAELPATGGMGTTLFYVLGGVLVTAAVVLLVTKKRMAN